MIVGIDGSNIRVGGGVTHLVNLLASADPEAIGIARFRVWARRETLDHLPVRPWIEPVAEPALDRPILHRLAWQVRDLPVLARSCDLLFAPGGTTFHRFSPIVCMSQNLLPFEWRELRRYGVSRTAFRLLMLRLAQRRAFHHSDGVIFLSEYAERIVRRSVSIPGATTVIPHGIDSTFLEAPRPQRPLTACSSQDPLRLLYVSIVDVYKHQWQVARAVAALRRRGIPLACTFVGPAYEPAVRRLRRVLADVDPRAEFLRYQGAVPHSELPAAYHGAELFIFASSCENMPNILIEAMASGLPIACSDHGPMPEMLGEAGLYFNPESPGSIMRAIERLAHDPELRARCAAEAHRRAHAYSWVRCARDTLRFLTEVRHRHERRRIPDRSRTAVERTRVEASSRTRRG